MSRDLVIDSSGALVEVEEGMTLSDVPEPVRKSAGKIGKIVTAEKVTRGTILSYELTVEKAGKKSEHAFMPDGTPKK